jgi:hypothetical protein
LTVGAHRDHRFSTIEQALVLMGEDFTPDELAEALVDQTHVEVSVSLLYRWRRDIADAAD